jgi:hypothetical protein
MRAMALIQSLSARDVRHKLVENISVTIQAFALFGLIMSGFVLEVAPQLRVTIEFCMLGGCLVCALVYLANELHHEAGTSLWFGAIVSGMLSCDLQELSNKLPMLAFTCVCLWLMWYVTPHPKKEPLQEGRNLSEEEANRLYGTTSPSG